MSRREELFWLLFLMTASAAWGFALAVTIFEVGG